MLAELPPDWRANSMTIHSFGTLVAEQLAAARAAAHGRSVYTVTGGSKHLFRHVVVALTAGRSLAEHDNPGQATVQVLAGQVILRAGDDSWTGTAGDLLEIPPRRHDLHAIEDSVVLLTIAKSATAIPLTTPHPAEPEPGEEVFP